MAEKKLTRPPVSKNKCEAFGLETICSELTSGESLTGVAFKIGVHVSTLLNWIEEDSQRAARAREARQLAGRIWDEKAETVLKEAADPFELTKARELASHYRWRAKAVSPKEYGDKVTQEHVGSGGGPIQMAAVNLKNLSDEELAQMQKLMAKAGEQK